MSCSAIRNKLEDAEWMMVVLVCRGWALLGVGLTSEFILKINILNCLDLALPGSYLALCCLGLAQLRSHFGSPCLE